MRRPLGRRVAPIRDLRLGGRRGAVTHFPGGGGAQLRRALWDS
jgi:hypothetical protein